MIIDLYTREIPETITWFNTFVGFKELKNRIDRANEKLNSYNFGSPVLNKRFHFHQNYTRAIKRNRLHQRVDLGDPDFHRVVSFVASVKAASRQLSDRGKSQLRSKILDSLSPDRDIRELEHEMRVFVHYRQQGYNVDFVDLEGRGNHDFTVTNGEVVFEVEAKTFSEDIGNLVSTENSLLMFDALTDVMSTSANFFESGILTYKVTTRHRGPNIRQNLASEISKFLQDGITPKSSLNGELSFVRRVDWEQSLSERNLDKIRDDMLSEHGDYNPHALAIIRRRQALLFCVVGNRPMRVFKGIRERLKLACGQLSGARPSVVWVHFLGLGEAEFLSAQKEDIEGRNSAFGSFGRYVFGSADRNHVCRLRFSADADQVTKSRSRIFVAGRSNMVSMNGPAYDLVSHVSRFDTKSVT